LRAERRPNDIKMTRRLYSGAIKNALANSGVHFLIVPAALAKLIELLAFLLSERFADNIREMICLI
jgi:hypothetical protein